MYPSSLFSFVLVLALLFAFTHGYSESDLFTEMRAVAELGAKKGSTHADICTDVCGLLDNDKIVNGQRLKSYHDICTKECPSVAKRAIVDGRVVEAKAFRGLARMVAQKRDEL